MKIEVIKKRWFMAFESVDSCSQDVYGFWRVTVYTKNDALDGVLVEFVINVVSVDSIITLTTLKAYYRYCSYIGIIPGYTISIPLYRRESLAQRLQPSFLIKKYLKNRAFSVPLGSVHNPIQANYKEAQNG